MSKPGRELYVDLEWTIDMEELDEELSEGEDATEQADQIECSYRAVVTSLNSIGTNERRTRERTTEIFQASLTFWERRRRRTVTE